MSATCCRRPLSKQTCSVILPFVNIIWKYHMNSFLQIKQNLFQSIVSQYNKSECKRVVIFRNIQLNLNLTRIYASRLPFQLLNNFHLCLIDTILPILCRFTILNRFMIPFIKVPTSNININP